MPGPRDDPFTKPKDQLGSIWNTVNHGLTKAANPLGFPQWPNPVNWLVDMEKLACQTTWQAWLKFALGALGSYAWTTLVPNPNEIVRKLVSGSYRCGFYFTPGFKSPMTLFIDEGGVEMFAEITRPFTTALFYWWLASSALGALSVFSTVLHKEDECPEEDTACQLRDAHAVLNWGTHETPPGLFTVLADPLHMDPGGTNHVLVPTGDYTASVAFELQSNFKQVDQLAVIIRQDGVEVARKTLVAPAAEPTVIGVFRYQGHVSGVEADVSTVVSYHMNNGPAAIADLWYHRWSVALR